MDTKQIIQTLQGLFNTANSNAQGYQGQANALSLSITAMQSYDALQTEVTVLTQQVISLGGVPNVQPIKLS